jgi:hypothetical protein
VYLAYVNLQRKSEGGRYLFQQFSVREVESALRNELKTIEDFVGL